MSLLTGLALRRRSVTVLIVLIVLVGGFLTYRALPVELFPEIEFPLVTVSTFYPSANPRAVVRDVTEPIENAISGVDGLEDIQSVSSENRSSVLANFKFGTDMDEAERSIVGNLSSIRFPAGVEQPKVGRINPDNFPVLLLSLLGDREIPELQRILDTLVLPAISSVEGVFSVDITGGVDRQVVVTVDPDRLSAMGISLFQVSSALSENNVTMPAGAITNEGQTFPVRTTYTYGSLEEINSLVVGFAGDGRLAQPAADGSGSGATQSTGASQPRPVMLSDVADVTLGAGIASSISRTNGKPSLGISVLKDPDANTVDVTTGVLEALASIADLPPDIQIVTISNDGPEIQAQVDNLQREALLGFLFAIAVVFIFLVTLRPTLLKGILLTVRPTAVIGMSIPLSIFTGILLMGLNGMSLNLMTLGGLAISVGRVVDDSIVVLENVYRHMQRGEDRLQVVLTATREVAPAITASTLTTIVVFVPLAFIQGLVGSFFLPFAITVSFALAASLLVALTAVPVLGAILLRPGDFPAGEATEGGSGDGETWIQRAYTPIILWALRHKAATLLSAFVLTVGSLGLIALIPITLFPSGGERFLVIDLELPAGASADATFAEVDQVEGVLAELVDRGIAEVYQTTVGNPDNAFGPGAALGPGGLNRASIFVRLAKGAPEDVVETLRATLAGDRGRTVTVTELGGGPPTAGLEVSITGNDYQAISIVASGLAADFSRIDGIVNVSSDVTEARDEIVINVIPAKAALLGLTTRDVSLQVNRFLVGQTVTQVELNGAPTSVVLRGRAEDVDSIDKIGALAIAGPRGSARLSDIAEVAFEKGPVTVSRSDGIRSARVTGAITAEDTQSVGRKVQARIDAFDLPPGIEVTTGGIFQQIAEGFQDIFLAMGVGVLLVYLVMVASLGSLRNPFVIVMSLPLALVGALAALAITGRTLGLPAMMGILLLVGIVVTNAIVLIAFVEQLRQSGMSVPDALVHGGRVRLRPILMTAFTTSFALLPLAAFVSQEGGIIGAELATVVIGGLVSSSFLTLIVVPVIYTMMHVSLPWAFGRFGRAIRQKATL
ncbi:MAG: efflux RND transporter permease subunit [Chloroflexi bacterium]|nr:efflux RND transporter permease subunit [Chloroflexota bacterium]